jgi:hypothetical protein
VSALPCRHNTKQLARVVVSAAPELGFAQLLLLYAAAACAAISASPARLAWMASSATRVQQARAVLDSVLLCSSLRVVPHLSSSLFSRALRSALLCVCSPVCLSLTVDGPPRAGTFSLQAGALFCQQCPVGTFSRIVGGASESACVSCVTLDPKMTTLRAGSTSPADCVCREGFFVLPSGVCSACATGMNCDAPGVTVAQLPVAKGFWRTPGSTIVRKCRLPKACRGSGSARRRLQSNTTEDESELCAPHYGGPMCEVCDPGYVMQE